MQSVIMSLLFIQNCVPCVSIYFIISMTVATWTGFSDYKAIKGCVNYEMQFSDPKINPCEGEERQRSVFVVKSKGLLLLIDLFTNTANGWQVFSIVFIFFKLSKRSSQSMCGSSQPIILLARLITLFISGLDLLSVFPPLAIIQKYVML